MSEVIESASSGEASNTEEKPKRRTTKASEKTSTKSSRTRKKAVGDKTHDAAEVISAVAESLAELSLKPARKPRTKKPVDIELDSITEAKAARKPRTKKAAVAEPGLVGDSELGDVEAPAPAKRTRRTKKSEATEAASSAIVLDLLEPKVTSVKKTSTKAEPAVAEPIEEVPAAPIVPAMTALLFQEPDTSRMRTRKRAVVEDTTVEEPAETPKKSRKRGFKVVEASEPVEVVVDDSESNAPEVSDATADEGTDSEPRRRRRGSRGRRKASDEEVTTNEEPQETPVAEEGEDGTRRRRRRTRERSTEAVSDEVTAPKGSTRLEAKRQRRKEGREAGRRRHTISESEYLARRESVKREMLVREQDGLNQIAVLEDDVLVEHYVARHTQVSMVGNVYLGRVQNVLPSMEAAFVDIGKGRNAVLYAGEVNWEAAGMEGKPRRIEQALKSGDTVLVQVTKDPIGHKGARLTAQITLAGRHLVLVPSGAMTGISRKLPDKERQRLKRLLREIVPAEHGVIVRTAAEGATEEQLRADVERLTKAWDDIQSKSKNIKSAPTLLKGEPELAVRVVRDIFNEDFQSLKVQGSTSWQTISDYVAELSPELSGRVTHWTDSTDIFSTHRVDEQLAKAFDRKVWLPSGGTLVIDRTEAMTVIDVNTGKFTGAGGTLEETVTRNNLEAAEEIVRQLRLRDIGGIIVVDFIDMVLEANRELVLRRLVECLGRDRTRHQVAEVTSLGLVQMTRKRVGQGLVEAFSTTCEACEGRGYITHTHPVEHGESEGRRRNKQTKESPAPAAPVQAPAPEPEEEKHEEVRAALSSIAAAAASKHEETPEEPKAKRSSRSRKKAEPREVLSAEVSPEAIAAVKDLADSLTTTTPELASDSASAESEERGEPRKAKRTSRKAAVKAGDAADAETPVKAERGSARVRHTSRKASSSGVIRPKKVEIAPDSEVATTAPRASVVANAASDAPEKAGKKRRAVSSGTITPGSGSDSAILSFPAE